jgi:hypothetical protein
MKELIEYLILTAREHPVYFSIGFLLMFFTLREWICFFIKTGDIKDELVQIRKILEKNKSND